MIKLLEKNYYEIPLPAVQRPGKVESALKKGVLYKIETQGGFREINLSPFPGFSDFTLKETEQAFEEALHNPATREQHIKANPHVEFAIYQINQMPLKSEDYPIKENELIGPDKLIDYIKSVQEKAVIKFKINKELSSSFLSELSVALKECSQPILLRPDANQTLSVASLTTLWNSLKEKSIQDFIDYFEEPLMSYSDYRDLPSDLPYAHEELLSDYLMVPSLAKALVVKPSQKGVHVLKRIKKVKIKKGASPRIIVSSAYEFEEDMPTLREIAHTYSPHEYHGLKASLSKSAISKTKTVKF